MSVGLSEKHTNMIIFLQTSRPTAKASNGLFHSCFHIHCIFRCNCTKEGLSVHHTFLDASSHLYKRLCPSVGPSVGSSETLS